MITGTSNSRLRYARGKVRELSLNGKRRDRASGETLELVETREMQLGIADYGFIIQIVSMPLRFFRLQNQPSKRREGDALVQSDRDLYTERSVCQNRDNIANRRVETRFSALFLR